MKIIMILLTSFFSFSIAFGQNNLTIDSRLQAKYSVQELERLQQNNIEELSFLTYSIENAFEITPLPEEKRTASEIRGEVTIENLDNINFFELGIDLIEDNYQYYIIKGTNKLLVVYSREEIKNKMNH